MFVKVIFPFGRSTFSHDFVSEPEVHKGDIVVVKQGNKEKFGVIAYVEKQLPPFDKIKGKVIRKADAIDQFDFWRLFEKKLIKDGIELTEDALKSYQLTKGNFSTPVEIAKKKLTRNLLLSHKPSRVYITGNRMIGLQYGALRMFYRNGVIHKIENHTNHPKEWKKNEVGYTYFSKLLGIEGL